jgi:TonB family protein
MEEPLSPDAEEFLGPEEITVAVPDPPPGTSRRPAAPVLVLSEDPVLLEAVAAAALDQATVIVSPSPDRFIDQVMATESGLAVIDAACVPTDLAPFLDSVHRQFPQLQLLLAAPGNVQHQISAQIADGTVFRFVHKPASAQRLKLFMDAALRARQTRITEEILIAAATSERRALSPASGRTRPAGWRFAGVLALAAAIGAGTLLPHLQASSRASKPASIAALPSADTQGAKSPVTPEVPPTVDPAAQAAAEKAAIDRAAAERSERSELERVAAESASRQAALAEQSRREASEASSQQLQSDARLGQQVEASELQLDPVTLQRAAADTERLVQAAAAEAVANLDAVETGGSEPPPAAAPASAASAPSIIEESKLQRVLFTPPAYPLEALIHKVTGIVELDFTVTTQGSVTDIDVTAADPAGVFEHAATTALAHSRYAPVLRDGVAVAQRAHIRLRFTL